MTDTAKKKKSTDTTAKGGKKDEKRELSSEDLNQVSGGAIPTPVNGQITDIVTPGGDDS
ncbi:MAG: hypothetical protein ISR48_10230 [Alphaproteobacteria bacterium]|nr:hypothetical protein [Alphaproteobacteria bacterium]